MGTRLIIPRTEVHAADNNNGKQMYKSREPAAAANSVHAHTHSHVSIYIYTFVYVRKNEAARQEKPARALYTLYYVPR